MRAMPKNIFIFLALLAAAILSVLLFVKHNEADIRIMIGRPVEASETAVDFTNSPKLSEEAENNILFALLSSRPLPDHATPNTPPDAIIMLQNDGVAYRYSAWVNEGGLIYAMQTDDEAADYRAAPLSSEELGFFEGINSMHKDR